MATDARGAAVSTFRVRQARRADFAAARSGGGVTGDGLVYRAASPIEVEGESLLFSIISDVTERERTEEELRASEEQYRDLFESVERDHVEVDNSGDLDATYDQIEAALGVEPAR